MRVQADTRGIESADERRTDSAAGEALRRMNFNSDLFLSLVKLLGEAASCRVSEMRRGMDAGDGRAVVLAAHSLHGATLTVGAVVVAELAHAVELAASRDARAGLADRIDTLEQAAEQFTTRVTDPAWLRRVARPRDAENSDTVWRQLPRQRPTRTIRG